MGVGSEQLAQSFPLPNENIYGHLQRLDWFKADLAETDRVVELGCGTGYMITIPLLLDGYDVQGVDLDAASIDYGRDLLRKAGLPEDRLSADDFRDHPGGLDAVILSEVLEHLPDGDIAALLRTVSSKLVPGGHLFVTVPNGYGLFELDSFLWFRLRLGPLLELVQVNNLIRRAKKKLCGEYVDAAYLSTLDSSPHVQRFTFRSIRRTLERAEFEVKRARGSVLFSGPFSNLLFTGCSRVMRANAYLGRRLPALSASFYVTAVRGASPGSR
jgi:2-polyprenyl-3-methyl-5-hydroxy-6-metoxy-1,4-benzoquinol methylase